MMVKDLVRSGGSAARPIIQEAHFDVAIVSASGSRETSGNPGNATNLLVKGLASLNKRSALFDCALGGEAGSLTSVRPDASALNAQAPRRAFAPRPALPVGDHGAHYACDHPDLMLSVASKLLCLDDRLFELNGGAAFGRKYVSAARRAGRMAGLLCTNLSTVFFNRQEIIESFGGNPDFVAGEPAAVLSLFGLKRIDTLVPRLIHRGVGLVLHRVDYPSLFVLPESDAAEIGDSPISREVFWSQFVPCAFEKFLNPVPA